MDHDDYDQLEAAVKAANGPAIATPEYQAVKRAEADLEAARDEVERRVEAVRAAYRAWGETPEYRAFIAARDARSDWQAKNLEGFRVARGVAQMPREPVS